MDKSKKINTMNRAVAIKYSPTEIAPKVVASGKGHVADRILEKAMSNDVAIYKDAALAEELSKMNIGDNIPPELYEVVAQVLVFISDIDKLSALKSSIS